ncbi:MAG: MBL fold metallo-hydrolase [Candidatus Calditenuis sp.]|nr:MBL fold metallo-hydrolase [Candidatus Calditenuis sp.]MDT7968504.1 MBL fold metallo-hydrolase [Candidatus Calditenuis sp.]
MELRRGVKGTVLVLDDGRSLTLDSDEESPVACVSHAHMDHLSGRSSSVALMTEETKLIFSVRGARYVNYRPLRFGESVAALGGSLRISARSSGHMLGSAAFSIDVDGLRLTYTGDMNTSPSVLHDPAEVVEGTDVLVIESTYGSPVYKFAEREEVYSEIVRWVREVMGEGSVPAFNVYAAGKAQELIALFNQTLDVPVVVSRNVGRVAEVYRRTYPWMEFLVEGTMDAAEVIRGGGFVYVADRRTVLPLRTRWAVATGWALTRRFLGYDAAFPLSSHADFYGLLEYVKATGPRLVVTVYGHSATFARFLNRMGYRSVSLDEKPVTRLI